MVEKLELTERRSEANEQKMVILLVLVCVLLLGCICLAVITFVHHPSIKKSIHKHSDS